MFGYVRPYIPELKVKDYEYYKAIYCGICKATKKIDNISRILLNYDFVFLYLLLISIEREEEKITKQTCIIHPFKKRSILNNNYLLEYVSYNMILLSYFKINDDIDDDRKIWLIPIKHRLKSILIKSDFFSSENFSKISSYLLQQKQLEKNNCSNIDQISDNFANVLKIIFGYNDNHNLIKIGYYIGKWIYLIDALDDFFADLKENRYNVLKNTFCDLDNKEYIYQELDCIKISLFNYVEMMKKFIPDTSHPIVSNIVDIGLYSKTTIVIDKFISTYKEWNNK